jgi:hypothetical protein
VVTSVGFTVSHDFLDSSRSRMSAHESTLLYPSLPSCVSYVNSDGSLHNSPESHCGTRTTILGKESYHCLMGGKWHISPTTKDRFLSASNIPALFTPVHKFCSKLSTDMRVQRSGNAAMQMAPANADALTPELYATIKTAPAPADGKPPAPAPRLQRYNQVYAL